MREHRDFVAILRAAPFFARLGEDALASLASLCTTHVLAPDELLFQKGDAGGALYGIRRGRIRISSGSEAGRATTLNILGSGDVFGEIALLDGGPRTAEARALERCELFVLRRRDFMSFLERKPSVAVGLIELLCERLRWMSDRVEEAALIPVEVRLARRVLMLARDYGSEVQISQHELGQFIGVSRERVNRQLKQWKRDGLVSVGRSRIGLLDCRRLSALCDAEAA